MRTPAALKSVAMLPPGRLRRGRAPRAELGDRGSALLSGCVAPSPRRVPAADGGSPLPPSSPLGSVVVVRAGACVAPAGGGPLPLRARTVSGRVPRSASVPRPAPRIRSGICFRSLEVLPCAPSRSPPPLLGAPGKARGLRPGGSRPRRFAAPHCVRLLPASPPPLSHCPRRVKAKMHGGTVAPGLDPPRGKVARRA